MKFGVTGSNQSPERWKGKKRNMSKKKPIPLINDSRDSTPNHTQHILSHGSHHTHAHSFTHTLNTYAHFLPQPHPADILFNVTTFVGIDDDRKSESKSGRGVERGQEINRVEVGVGRSDGLGGTTDCVGVCAM